MKITLKKVISLVVVLSMFYSIHVSTFASSNSPRTEDIIQNTLDENNVSL